VATRSDKIIPASTGTGAGWRDMPALLAAGAIVWWGASHGTVQHLQLTVCLLAAVGWLLARLDPTVVALAGALGVAAVGVLAGSEVASAPLAHLGDDTTVLIIAAFILAQAVERSGLARRITDALIGRSTGGLAYARLALGVFAATFMIPATSARAGVLVPLVERAKAGAGTRGTQRAIALMAPLVVVLAAFGYPVAAAANLLAIQILASQSDVTLAFATWIAMATPFAALMAILAASVPWLMYRSDRRPPLCPTAEPTAAAPTTDDDGAAPTTDDDGAAVRTALVLVTVVALWCGAAWHPIEPMLVALLGAVLVTLPHVGALSLPQALKGVDWAVVVLLAAAAQLSETAAANPLVASATASLADAVAASEATGPIVLAALTVIAMAAHLLVGSRSARSLLLLPATLAVATAAELDPVIAVLAVTAGAGFCVLTPVGSKALVIFAGGGRDFDRRALVRAGLVLAPMQLAATLAFALWIWPALAPGG